MIRSTVFVATLFALPSAALAEFYQYHPASPMKLGSGYNPTAPKRAYPPCLDLADGYETAAGGARVQFTSDVVRSQRDLFTKLNVDASLSARYKFANASAQFSLENEVTFHSDDLVWAIRAFSDFGTRELRAVRLDTEAMRVSRSPAKFLLRCGTEYVQKERRVAQLVAVFTMHNLSQTEKSRIEASFSGGVSGLVGGVEFSSAYRSFLTQAAKTSQVTLKVYGFGGQGVSAMASLVVNGDDIDAVRNTLSQYVRTLTEANAVSLEYSTGEFSSLIGTPSPGPFVEPPQLAATYFAYQDASQKLDRLHAVILAADDAYSYLTDDQLSAYRASYNAYTAEVNALFLSGVACIKDGRQCKFRPATSLRVEWPINPNVFCTSWKGGVCLACSFPVRFLSERPPFYVDFSCSNMPPGATVQGVFDGFIVVTSSHPDNKVFNGWVTARLAIANEDCESDSKNQDRCKDGHVSGGSSVLMMWKPLHMVRTQTVVGSTSTWRLHLTKCQTGPSDGVGCDSVPPGIGSPLVGASHGLPAGAAAATLQVKVMRPGLAPPPPSLR